MASVARSSSDWINLVQARRSRALSGGRARLSAGPSASRLAHVLERIGLSMMGAAGGIFVAAQLGKSGVELLTFPVVVLAMTVYAAFGFYLGIDLPAAPASGERSGTRAKRIERLSGAGTFFAALAAFVSVCSLVLDARPPALWTLLVGSSFLLGVAMQIAAGTIARARG